MPRLTIAFCAVLFLFPAACGDGEEKKDAVITVTLTLPDLGPQGGADLGDRLLEAFGQQQAGEILAVRKSGRVMEVSMKIRDLGDINRIKKAIIRVEPGTEYRIEHN